MNLSFWAKTDSGRKDGLPSTALLTHATHAGLAARELILDSALQAEIHGPVVLAVGCHDIGKASLGFLLRSDVWRELFGFQSNGQLITDHTLLGALILRFELGLPLPLVKAIASHHGRLITDSAPGARAVYEAEAGWKQIDQLLPSLPFLPSRDQLRALASGGVLVPDRWQAARRALAMTLSERVGVSWPTTWPADLRSLQLQLIAGLCVISDWVASSIPGVPGEYLQPKTLEACKADVDKVMATLQLRESVKILPAVNSFDRLTGRAPRACQRIEYRGPGLYLIEAPTGAGKTEVAMDLTRQLIQAGHACGLFFTLPTRISSKEIFGRIQRMLIGKTESTAIKLVHSTSWIEDVSFQAINCGNSEDAQERGRWLNGRRKGLLSPIGAGPMDQVLLAFVRSKFFFLRLWALQQKVIVIDELHSYSAYMVKLLAQALPMLKEMGCTVIVLSATLTQRAKEELLKASGLTEATLPDRTSNSQALHVDLEGKLTVQALDTSDCTTHPEVAVYKHFTPLDVRAPGYRSAIGDALQAALAGEKVLWICNTVRAAQAVYAYAKSAGVPVPLGLIHSRFTTTDRRGMEKYWLEFFATQTGGCLLIGTQVLEQSIDLDSDRMFSELAPIELLIQRIGRLWRKWKEGRQGLAAPLHVLLPSIREPADFGGGWWVYENRFELLRAQRIVPDTLDKNHAWRLLEIGQEATTTQEQELIAGYSEQVQRELILAIARGLSMEDKLMDDGQAEGTLLDDPDENPVVRLQKIPTTRVCIMRDKHTFWHWQKDTKAESGRELFERLKSVELNVVQVPSYLFRRGTGTGYDREARAQIWIDADPETQGGLCYNSEVGAFSA